jgi:hypothetical protein
LVRTTLNLEDDIMRAARAIAEAEQRSIGDVISDLVRRGLAPSARRMADEEGFPIFHVEPDAPVITSEMVRVALEDL